MTFPGNLPAATVTGTLWDTNGLPLTGILATLIPSVNRVVDPSTGDIFYRATATFTSDATTGAFTVDLIPCDDPDASPINWWYDVTLEGNDNADQPLTDTFRAVVVHDQGTLKLAAIIDPGPDNGPITPVRLGMLVDVDFTVAPTNGQALVYNTTAKKWKAGTVSGGGGGAGTVVSVNGITPDGGGDITLDANDVGGVATGDSRLTNARTPTAHAASHATGGSDAITLSSIGGITQTAADARYLKDLDGAIAKLVASIEPVIRWDGTGTPPLRATVTTDLTKSVLWSSPVVPPTTTGFAVAGVDFFRKVPA